MAINLKKIKLTSQTTWETQKDLNDNFADIETALEEVPTSTSDLTNDGDGESPFATEAYVGTNGGKIDSISVNGTTKTIDANKNVNITVPVTAADVSALPASTKYGAGLTLSINSTTYVVTAQLKDQDGNNLGTAQTIDLPLESVVVNGSYDSTNKKVVLTLQSGSTIEFSVADLVSGLQTEITSSNKLDADLVDDSTSSNKFVTASDKSAWNAKQNALPTTATAGKVLKSTSTAGTVEWADDTNTNDNQKVKAGSVTFGDNDVVDIVAGNNVTVTGDASAKTITIASSYTDTNQKIKALATTFGNNATVNLVPGNGVTMNVTPTEGYESITFGGTPVRVGAIYEASADNMLAYKAGCYTWEGRHYIKFTINNISQTFLNASYSDIPITLFYLRNNSNTVEEIWLIGNIGSINTGTTYNSVQSGDLSCVRMYIDNNTFTTTISTCIKGTVNGSTNSQNFYAPTSVGTSGQVLKSSGSGAPTWTDLVTYIDFTDSQTGWSSIDSDGFYTLTLTSAKLPLGVYKTVNSKKCKVEAGLMHDGTNVYIVTDTKFSGSVAVI